MHPFESHSSPADDQSLLGHAYMLACNGSIAYRLLEHLGFPCAGKTVLDLGAGSGQVCRFLRGIPGLILEACDIDPASEEWFRTHPELRDIKFYCLDFLEKKLPRTYDAIVCRGVYHHIAKALRPRFLRLMCEYAPVAIIADEGIREYATLDERKRNCDSWYGYVIGEARREGQAHLAATETRFWKHEQLQTADDGGDFKESPSHLVEDAREANLPTPIIDRVGPWHEFGGGFFTASFVIDH